jgi:hypothetical protein
MRHTQAALPVGLRAELIYLVMGFIESLWIAPLLLIFLPGSVGVPGYQMVLLSVANLTGALVLVRLLNNAQMMGAAFRIGAMVSIALIVLTVTRVIIPAEAMETRMVRVNRMSLAFPPILLTLVIIAALWYRGSRLATITVTPLRASFALRLGIVMLMFIALIPDARVQRAVLLLLPLFFFFGLIGVALARSASLRLNREVYQSTFGVSWVLLTFTIGAMLSVFGFVGALVLSGFRFEHILDAISDVLVGVIAVGTLLISPLLELLTRLGNLFFARERPNPEVIVDQDAIANRIRAQAGTTDLAEQIARAIPMLCLSALLIFIFVLILIRLRVQRPVRLRDGEERETVEGGDLLKNLRAAFNNGLQNLADRLGELNPLAGREAITAYTIRRLYARLTRLAEQAGTPRLSHQTPLEYQAVVARLWPAHTQEIGELTRAYVDVHYGELPDDPGIVQRALTMLEQIEELVKKAEKSRAPTIPV